MARSGRRVQFDTNGLRLTRAGWFGRREVARLAWRDLVRIEARRARGRAAQVELVLDMGGGEPVVTSSADRGFDGLRAALPGLLRAVDEVWWTALAEPQPQARRYLVWERA